MITPTMSRYFHCCSNFEKITRDMCTCGAPHWEYPGRTCVKRCQGITWDPKKSHCNKCGDVLNLAGKLIPVNPPTEDMSCTSCMLCIKIPVEIPLGFDLQELRQLNPGYQSTNQTHITLLCAWMSPELKKFLEEKLGEILKASGLNEKLLCELDGIKYIKTDKNVNMIALYGNTENIRSRILQEIRDLVWLNIFKQVGCEEAKIFKTLKTPIQDEKNIIYETPMGNLMVKTHDAYKQPFMPHVTLLRTSRQVETNLPNLSNLLNSENSGNSIMLTLEAGGWITEFKS